MFWNVLSIEHTKILKRRLFWILLILTALTVLANQLVLYAIVTNRFNGGTMPAEVRNSVEQMITWLGSLVSVFNFIGGDAFGGIFVIILVGAVTAQEYTRRTLHLWLSRGVPRRLLGTAEFVAILLPILVMVSVAAVASGPFTAFVTTRLNDTLNLSQVDLLQLGLSLLRAMYTLLPYGALTFFLAVASRSTLVAISGGLVYVFLVESLLINALGMFGETVGRIARYLPVMLAENLLSLNQATIRVSNSLPAGLRNSSTAWLSNYY